MKICLGCMKKIEDERKICPHCGYFEGTPAPEPYILPPGTILQGKYVAGQMISRDSVSITYIALDAMLERIVELKEFFPQGQVERANAVKNQLVQVKGDIDKFQTLLEKFFEKAKSEATIEGEGAQQELEVYDCFLENSTGYIVTKHVTDEISVQNPSSVPITSKKRSRWKIIIPIVSLVVIGGGIGVFLFLNASKNKLTVENGTGSGKYKPGQEVQITADEPEEGKEFAEWKYDVELENPPENKEEATLIMPDEDITIEATYQFSEHRLNVYNGSGSGKYRTGEEVTITAGMDDEEYEFVEWTVNNGKLELDDPTSETITFTMPEEDVTITADFEQKKYTVSAENASGGGEFAAGATVILSVPEDKKGGFLQWNVKKGKVTIDDLLSETIEFTMPNEEVIIEAEIDQAILDGTKEYDESEMRASWEQTMTKIFDTSRVGDFWLKDRPAISDLNAFWSSNGINLESKENYYSWSGGDGMIFVSGVMYDFTLFDSESPDRDKMGIYLDDMQFGTKKSIVYEDLGITAEMIRWIKQDKHADEDKEIFNHAYDPVTYESREIKSVKYHIPGGDETGVFIALSCPDYTVHITLFDQELGGLEIDYF